MTKNTVETTIVETTTTLTWDNAQDGDDFQALMEHAAIKEWEEAHPLHADLSNIEGPCCGVCGTPAQGEYCPTCGANF